MITCYVKILLTASILILCYAISYLPLILIQSSLPFDQFLTASLAWFLLVLFSLPFSLNHFLQKIWFFKGKGKAITPEELESLLMAVNTIDCPVMVRKKPKQYILTWRYTDQHWSERMAIEGITKSYVLKLKVSQSTQTLKMIDRMQYINLDLSPIKVRTSWLLRPRLYCHTKCTREIALQKLLSHNGDHYRFKPQEIKSPLFTALINNGWNVRFALF